MLRLPSTMVILTTVLVVCLSLMASVAMSVELYRFDRAISGQIVNYVTHKPVANAVVSAVWFHDLIRFSEAPQRQLNDYYETLTDEQGNFKIPGKGLSFFRKVGPPNLSIFKADYSVLHLRSVVPGHSRDLPSGEGLTWRDGKAIISFRKKQRTERKRLLNSRASVPLFQMLREGFSSEKMRLYAGELEKEFGTAQHVADPNKLNFKKGGTFPGGEKTVKPRPKD